MRGFNLGLLLCSLFVVVALANCAQAQFWFQSGVFGSRQTEYNNGASVSIQTVWQNISDGSLGFWIGENLENDAFMQVGYQIVNVTGYYPTSCDQEGCVGSVLLTAGKPTWFWEYFPVEDDYDTFLGGIGGDGSAGSNGTFNTYSFLSEGNVWTTYFNNQSIGSVDLGTSRSGVNPPTVIGEIAETHSNTQEMLPVIFKDMKFYKDGELKMVPTGFGYIGYGISSETYSPNPYGVGTIGNYVNYFAVGSGMPLQNKIVLWNLGYALKVVSAYGGLSEKLNYSAYSIASLHAQKVVNISDGTRAVFLGWVGEGPGSYTGQQANVSVNMDGNITETAKWDLQYYVGVNSSYVSSGGGWYNSNSTATLDVGPGIVGLGDGVRAAFMNWSTGANTTSIKVLVDEPKTLTALWVRQYLINATADYGSVYGAGWYDEGSKAELRLNETYATINQDTRFGFYKWSNGCESSITTFTVNAPVSPSAAFKKQYRINFVPKNVYGNAITDVEWYDLNGVKIYGNSTYLFANQSYSLDHLHYRGSDVDLSYIFTTYEPKTLLLTAPLYDVQISAVDVFGRPLNASINVTFDNRTNLVSYLGANGLIEFQNVPYGKVSGYVEYGGLIRSVTLFGGSARLLFVTPSLIAVIIIAITSSVLLGRFARSRCFKSRK